MSVRHFMSEAVVALPGRHPGAVLEFPMETLSRRRLPTGAVDLAWARSALPCTGCGHPGQPLTTSAAVRHRRDRRRQGRADPLVALRMDWKARTGRGVLDNYEPTGTALRAPTCA
ncbi:hypothetical protein GCM10018773_62530 [Streptomyces candidus]|nr:hypothetical protein GCM10018773_62530 [Streptomyces candidus]